MRNEIILRAEPQRQHALTFLQGLKLNPDKPFVLTIEPYRKKRTLSQNALLWKRHSEVCAAVSAETGYSNEDVHELMKQMFLPPKIIEVNGQVIKRYSSKNLTTAEMSAFMGKIEAFAQTELGIILTVPEERFAR